LTSGVLRLDPTGLQVRDKGELTVRPAASMTYFLRDARGQVLAQTTVSVQSKESFEPARVCGFEASAHAVLPGEPVVLRWDCTGTNKVRLEPGGLELDGQSEITVTPQETTRYTITATNMLGGSSRSVDVIVLKAPQLGQTPQVCSFSADRTSVKAGEAVELRWECAGGTKVRLEPGGLELDGMSRITVVPGATTVYTLSVSNIAGGTSRSLELQVADPVPEVKDANEETQLRQRVMREGRLREALVLGQSYRDHQKNGTWTLRLAVMAKESTLGNIAAQSGSMVDRLVVLPYPRKDGLPWWQVVVGTYPSKDAAKKAWNQLPESLRQLSSQAFPIPWKSAGVR
jgi:SPOR domain